MQVRISMQLRALSGTFRPLPLDDDLLCPASAAGAAQGVGQDHGHVVTVTNSGKRPLGLAAKGQTQLSELNWWAARLPCVLRHDGFSYTWDGEKEVGRIRFASSRALGVPEGVRGGGRPRGQGQGALERRSTPEAAGSCSWA